MLRVVVMVSIFNEEDFIAEVIENLLDQGLEVVALDHGSTDRSFDICSELGAHRGFDLRRWRPETLNLEALTLRLYRMAQEHRPDWLIFSDGDEIQQSRERGRTVHQVVSDADASGSNIVQYDRFDFFMCDKDDPAIESPRRRLRHYSWQGDFNYRAFKNVPGVRANPSFAHYPLFPDGYPYRIGPERLILRHYPYRSPDHAERKISNILDKIASSTDGPQTWHSRYLRIASGRQHILPTDHRRLTRYQGDDNWIREPRHTPFTDPQPTAEDLFTDRRFLRHTLSCTIDWSGTDAEEGPPGR
jgi:glycosyltransferase involved in cell wall biosynthesis